MPTKQEIQTDQMAQQKVVRMVPNPDFVYCPPMTPYLEVIYKDNDIVVLN